MGHVRTTCSARSSRTSVAGWAMRSATPMGFDSFGLPPRTQPSRRAATRGGRAKHRRDPSPDGAHGLGIDWDRSLRDARPRVLPLDAVALPALLRPRPCLPQGRLSSGARTTDRPRERAGDRRALRALRRGGRVRNLEQWFFGSRPMRTPCWTRWRCSSRGRSASSPMQRNWIGRSDAELVFRVGARPGSRSSPRGRTRSSAPPSSCSREAPAGRRPRRRHRARGRGGRVRAPRGGARRSSVRRRRRTESSQAATWSTRRRASRSRSGWRTTCSWSTGPAPSWAPAHDERDFAFAQR